jgi:Copine/C2 domain
LTIYFILCYHVILNNIIFVLKIKFFFEYVFQTDGFFSKSDPFFEVSKHISANGGSSWQVIYRSESIKNNLNPTWKEVTLSMTDLCGGDRNLPILISVFDYESNGKHISMGYFQTNVNALINSKISTAQATADPKTIDTSKAFSLLMKGRNFGSIVVAEAVVEGEEENTSNPTASSMPPFSNPTTTSTTTSSSSTGYSSLTPTSPSVTPYAQNTLSPSVTPYTHYPSAPKASSSSPTFLDYISGGLELQLSVAIDFTGSNGDPRRPGTLHYIDRAGGSLNCYEKALTAVGSIVAKYDSDQRFPMLGFGAKFHGIIHHCFQLGPTAEVQGVKGMLEAYRSIFQSGLTMSGPTVFSEVIQVTSAQARTQQAAASRIGQQVYNILLILTDGAVTDLIETQQAIRAASDAPISIIIVGIGQADFGGMQYLDDFMSQGGTGRDICQFVEFHRHENNKLSLTQAVLEEIPTQVVDYFMSHGIRPLPAIRGSLMNIMAEESVEDEIDLALDIEDNGNIHVVSGGMTDDTSYGSYNTYAGITPLAPPGAMSPTYSAPSQPNLGVSQANLYSSPSQAHVAHSRANLYTPNAPIDGPSNASFVAPSAPTPTVFHVRIPPGIMPGQQLQVVNPKTQAPMIITVPHGVPPDRIVAVPY